LKNKKMIPKKLTIEEMQTIAVIIAAATVVLSIGLFLSLLGTGPPLVVAPLQTIEMDFTPYGLALFAVFFLTGLFYFKDQLTRVTMGQLQLGLTVIALLLTGISSIIQFTRPSTSLGTIPLQVGGVGDVVIILSTVAVIVLIGFFMLLPTKPKR